MNLSSLVTTLEARGVDALTSCPRATRELPRLVDQDLLSYLASSGRTASGVTRFMMRCSIDEATNNLCVSMRPRAVDAEVLP